ncbi:hypothetical protein A4D02_15975 [Niastella koreensis]|uniref:Tetratricopeptide TPR_2 repeat-containing protein n=2 Tax=Niastella koreensis TaxID=354356 RepID=G8TPF5_NIAKG|nr:tetratricopeptide repeat protein [Niastella koreensis]AEV97776.1 Tetratricopeptide TPR_2 repeat-containing protein [Niastella koreensis GR20-10]OQP40412.1 hypothetical protein A4D02_15975 [Niastella koreensis]
MLTQQDITELLSGFYAHWALKIKGPDMVLMAELLEDLRPSLEQDDAHDAWDYLKIDPEKYSNELCKSVLNELRQSFFELLFEKQFMAVQQLAATNTSEATNLLRQYYAEALVHYREDFVCLLLKQAFQLGEPFETWKKAISKVPVLLWESRWVDLYPFFQDIYNDSAIGAKERCLAEAISGLIVLYSFPVFTHAEKHFQNALELQPDHLIPRRCMGELYMKQGEDQKAREVFLEVINKQCRDYVAYNLVGDTFFSETKVKLEQATALPKDVLTNEEYWYNEGWRNNLLQVDSCRRLITLYSYNAVIYAEHNNKMPGLMKAAEQLIWYPEKKRFRFTHENYSACFYDSNYYHTCRDLAANYRAMEDFENAEKLYREAIQLQPQLSPAYIDLGYACIKDKKFDAAKEQLNKALSLDKDSYDALWNLAYYYEETQQPQEAINTYEICKKIRPVWADWANNFIGNVYFDQEDFEKAIPYYRDAMNQNPDYYTYKDNLVLAKQRLSEQKEKADQTEEAAGLLKEVIELTQSPRDWNKLGNFYYRNSQFKEAETCYAKAVELLPEDPIYHENLGLAYKNQGLFDKAEPEFLEAARLNTKDGDSLNQAGLFYYDQQKFDDALTWFRKALEKQPDVVDFNVNVGLAFERKKEFDKARPYYEQAAVKAPKDDTIQNRIGLTYYDQNNHPKAIEYFQKAVALNPAQSVYLENIASSYALMGNKDEAENYYRKAIAVNPNSHKPWNELAVIHIEKADYDNAITYLNKALALDPNNYVYTVNIARAYGDTGQKEQAIQAYEKALKLDGNDYLNWNSLGNLYFETGNMDNAMKAYNKAIQLNPAEKVFIGNKALIYIQEGRWADAEQLVNTELDENTKTFFLETVARLYPELQISNTAASGIKIMGVLNN